MRRGKDEAKANSAPALRPRLSLAVPDAPKPESPHLRLAALVGAGINNMGAATRQRAVSSKLREPASY